MGLLNTPRYFPTEFHMVTKPVIAVHHVLVMYFSVSLVDDAFLIVFQMVQICRDDSAGVRCQSFGSEMFVLASASDR
jgi:hypothetical protein